MINFLKRLLKIEAKDYICDMETYKVEILNPKVTKLLKDLADLDLITLRKSPDDAFMNVIKKLRKKASEDVPTQKEIDKEVETVRAKRYARKAR